MDREQFREQITQRYVAGKALDGASLEEISAGMVDPVEQMNYVTGQAKKGCATSSSGENSPLGWLLFISLIALALLSGIIKLFL